MEGCPANAEGVPKGHAPAMGLEYGIDVCHRCGFDHYCPGCRTMKIMGLLVLLVLCELGFVAL